MERKIGICSICGGDVVHHEGAWYATIPPPPPHCVNCGAVSADSQRVIPMVPHRSQLIIKRGISDISLRFGI